MPATSRIQMTAAMIRVLFFLFLLKSTIFATPSLESTDAKATRGARIPTYAYAQFHTCSVLHVSTAIVKSFNAFFTEFRKCADTCTVMPWFFVILP